MCYRFYMEMSPALKPIVEEALRAPLKDKMIAHLAKPLTTEGEVRPTQMVPVIARDKNGQIKVYPMVWGFQIPRSRAPIVNARVETAADKPTFRESWKQHRCIVPASYYFEWEHQLNNTTGKVETGQKYMIQPPGQEVTYLAGLYRIEERNGFKMPVFTILTREPGESIRFIHDRMPVILPKESIPLWTSPEEIPERALGTVLTDMVYEAAE